MAIFNSYVKLPEGTAIFGTSMGNLWKIYGTPTICCEKHVDIS
jgi:hypothetical protein